MNMYLGGYNNVGISKLDLNNYSINKISNYDNTSYMYKDNNYLYSIVRINGKAGIIKFEILEDKLNVLAINIHESIPSCYVTVINNNVYSCNYHLGTLNIYDKQLTLINTIKFKTNSKIHCVEYHNNSYYVCDLGDNCILKLNSNYEITNTIRFNNIVGPRHIISNNDLLYCISELSKDLIIIKDDYIIKTINLNNDSNNSGAAIRIDNNYIYVSIRGLNKIIVLSKKDYTIIYELDTLGKDPRDFNIYNNLIVIGHQNTNNIVIYKDFKLVDNIEYKGIIAIV